MQCSIDDATAAQYEICDQSGSKKSQRKSATWRNEKLLSRNCWWNYKSSLRISLIDKCFSNFEFCFGFCWVEFQLSSSVCNCRRFLRMHWSFLFGFLDRFLRLQRICGDLSCDCFKGEFFDDFITFDKDFSGFWEVINVYYQSWLEVIKVVLITRFALKTK